MEKGANLRAAFNIAVNTDIKDGAVVILTFDYYKKDFNSLKEATRTSAKSKKVPHEFHIFENSSIEKKNNI